MGECRATQRVSGSNHCGEVRRADRGGGGVDRDRRRGDGDSDVVGDRRLRIEKIGGIWERKDEAK